MIRDVSTTVKTDKNTYEIIVTGDQITQTVRRRMATLAPKERILDISETGEGLDLGKSKAQK